jgi:hypothetical protein
MKKFTTIFIIYILFPSLAEALTVKHDFFVTVGLFDASKTEFIYSLNKNNYKIASKITTNGFFNTIYPFEAKYVTSGTIKNSQMTTIDYNYESKSRSKKRSKTVFYENGQPIYQHIVQNGKEKKHNFTPSPTPADTFDLQTVIAKIIHQFNELNFCDSILKVYDGRRRFDVIIKDEGSENLTANEHSFYTGTAYKCSMHIQKVLSDDDDQLWEISSNRPILFWFARDEKSKYPFIAKIYIKNTPLGELTAHTTNITIEE